MLLSTAKLSCGVWCRCRDCGRTSHVFTAGRHDEVYVHLQTHCRPFLRVARRPSQSHSSRNPLQSSRARVPSLPPLPLRRCGLSCASSACLSDFYASPSSRSSQPALSSPSMRSSPSACTHSSCAPLFLLLSERSRRPCRSALTGASLHRPPLSQAFPRVGSVGSQASQSCHPTALLLSSAPSLSRSRVFESSPCQRTANCRSFASSRPFCGSAFFSASPGPQGDVLSLLSVTRSSSYSWYTCDSPRPALASSSSSSSSARTDSPSVGCNLATTLFPLDWTRVSSSSSSLLSRQSGAVSLPHFCRRSYRKGRSAPRRRDDEASSSSSSSLLLGPAALGHVEDWEGRIRESEKAASSFGRSALRKKDGRNEENGPEDVYQEEEETKKSPAIFSHAPSDLPQRSRDGSRAVKSQKTFLLSKAEGDSSASFASRIPGDAFIEFTTETVARLWGGGQQERTEEEGRAFARARERRTDEERDGAEEDREEDEDSSAEDCARGRKARDNGRRRRNSTEEEEEGREEGGGGGSRRRRLPRLLFPAIDDAELPHLPLDTLDAQRLLYVLGRASVLAAAEAQDTRSGDPAEEEEGASCSSLGPKRRSADASQSRMHPPLGELLSLSRTETSEGSQSSCSIQSSFLETTEEKKTKESHSSATTLVSPSGAETSPLLLADNLDFWISIYTRLGSLLPTLAPREFARAVQGLGYVRPRLLQLADRTLRRFREASETDAVDSRGDGRKRAPPADATADSSEGGRGLCDTSGSGEERRKGKADVRSSAGGEDFAEREEAMGAEGRKAEKAPAVSAGQARKFLEVDASLVVQLRRQVGLQATGFHGDCLSRVFYGMVRGQMEGDAQFLDFFTSEVLERFEKKLRPWHIHKMFLVSLSSPHVGRDFQSVLANHLVSNLAYLPANSFSEFVPKLVEAGLVRPAHVIKINIISGKRLRAWKNPTLLLSLGYPLVMYDLITPGNAIALFRALQSLGLPEPYPPRKESLASSSASSFASQATDEGEHRRAVRRINKHLIPLKLMEIRLRIDRPNVYATFSPRLRGWLKTVRDAPLTLTSFGHPFEQAHVNAPLLQGAAEIAEEHFFFHPHLEGPFLLELAAPLSQISLEWDEPWRFYPPFQEFERRVYTDCRRKYLRCEGWTVATISARAFRALAEADRKRWVIEELKKAARHALAQTDRRPRLMINSFTAAGSPVRRLGQTALLGASPIPAETETRW